MLYIVRGAADSNRDKVAKQLVVEHNGIQIEADDFFVKNGEYVFNPHQLTNAHQWCLNQVKMNLRAGHNVVLSNTSTQLWEFQSYMGYCNSFGIPFDIFDCLEKGTNKYNTPAKSCKHQRNRFQQLPTILSKCVPKHTKPKWWVEGGNLSIIDTPDTLAVERIKICIDNEFFKDDHFSNFVSYVLHQGIIERIESIAGAFLDYYQSKEPIAVTPIKRNSHTFNVIDKLEALNKGIEINAWSAHNSGHFRLLFDISDVNTFKEELFNAVRDGKPQHDTVRLSMSAVVSKQTKTRQFIDVQIYID